MAASTGTHSYSTTFNVDPTGGSTFAAWAEVTEINGPGIKVGSTELTNLNSPNAAKEKTPGLIDAGQLTLKCNFTKVQYALMLTNLRTKGMALKITFPLVGAEITASTLTGTGFIAELGIAIPEDDRITNDVTIEWSGLPVFTAGT